MNKENTTVVFGPPGTGKTTYLLNLVDTLLEKGVSSKHIAFLSFTRKAANEARDRACAKFNLMPKSFPWFRTIHSLCYIAVTTESTKLIEYRHYKDFGAKVGMSFSYAASNMEEGVPMLQTKGDKYLHFYNLLRVTKINARQLLLKYSSEYIDEMEFEFFINSYEAYKKSVGVVDFTDLLVSYIASDHKLPISHLIVDEAQDLSKLQWEIVKKIGSYCTKVYVAGDDDQAIYKWSGADVDELIDMPSENVIVLDQSYRVPIKIQRLAKTVSDKITHRVDKDYHPRNEEGSVQYVGDLSELNLDEGTWLLLARNNCYLTRYVQECLSRGIFFECSVKTEEEALPTNQDLNAIVSWQRLINAKPISSGDFKDIASLLRVSDGVIKYGFKKKITELPNGQEITLDLAMSNYGLQKFDPWYLSLGGISDKKKQFIVACLKKGEKLTRKPRIKISTIHGTKGGEADNVVLMPDMTLKTYTEYHKDPDSEHRVWYVALTRSKNTIYLASPVGLNYYEI